ncbi:hypothetical protein MM236_06490 [Belliella sp. DSM 107340]|uniref:6-bladed beta-propeller protein n=1 Tax=Belliella calami TaxID=2923436 RepID=A0ABS9UMX2_9BACT|nr:hypothetical protein [Belliella calami]MCH7397628.1 hypothetical protein [Belliella calami]
MKKRVLSFVFIINSLISCNQSEEQVFEIQQGNLTILDSVKIDDSGFSFGEVYNPRVYNDSILGFGDATFRSINLFHSKSGAFLSTYETDSIDSYQLPVKDMSFFYIDGDRVFILNDLVRNVFVFDLDKNFIEKIELKFSDFSQKPAFEGFFEIHNNSIFLSSVNDGTLSERFKYSKIVTEFDLKGNYINDFGNYPKPYTEGNLVLSTNESKIIKDEKIYILNVAGVPILKEYLLNGDLNGVYKLESEHHDPEIGYYINDPFSAPLTDQFNGLASDQNSSKKVFYASYHSFDTRDRDYGLGTYRWMLMKIDLEKMTIKEAEIAGAWYLDDYPNLIPQAKGDTVSFLIREKDENLYLKRLIFD